MIEWTAVELASRIRRRDVSAVEVAEAHLAQIERVNPRVNAIVTLLPREQILRAARQADEAIASGGAVGRLHGLPIAHKDLQDTEGIRTTYGSKLFEHHVPTASSLTVERLRRAGAITIGKTNVPEWGAGSQTFNAVFGATRNAYDLTKTAGGSSGGAAVALATNMIPIADGSDLGGSLRNPASWSNVVGLRCSAGRVPSDPSTLPWFGLAVDGPMARSVADVALMLSVMAGPDARCPISLQEPGGMFARPLGADVKGRRIAWAKDLGGLPFEREVKQVVDSRIATFEALGCVVEQAEPDFAGADFAFKTLRAFLSNAAHGERLAQGALYKEVLREEIERGGRLTARDLSEAERARGALYQRVRVFFEKYDYFVVPVTQVAPFEVHQEFPMEIEGVRMESYIDWMKSCYLISITGLPAIAVPAGFTTGGLPIGLQIIGKPWGEWAVLEMAQAFEESTGLWKQRPRL